MKGFILSLNKVKHNNGFWNVTGSKETNEPSAQEDSTMPMKVIAAEMTDQRFDNVKRVNQF